MVREEKCNFWQGSFLEDLLKKAASFFFSLLLLAAAAAFVFFVGWTQFKVRPGFAGVVVSKTGGVCPRPVLRSEFSWHWEFLLPTNAELRLFDLRPRVFEKVVSGVLPSGKEYAKVFGSETDFSYNFVFSVEVQFSESDVADLVLDGKVFCESELESLLERNATFAANASAKKIVSLARENPGKTVEEILQENFSEIEEEAAASAKGFGKVSVALLSHYFPDFALYEAARLSYAEYCEEIKNAASEAARRDADENARFSAAMQKMKSLGDVLKTYPELSEILKNSDSVSSTLRTIDEMDQTR